MVADEESEQPAAAPSPLGPKKTWPSSAQLEKWLMASSKDADPSATFLRRMLQVNPAYGAYLSSNEDLAELVMLFAKRFRSKMLHCSQPIKPDELYEPLLEVVWRVVGHTFHTIMELQDNQHLPVPQMALGQVKMLLQTNEELSRQLKENRRAYLKELVLLREKAGRQLSNKAQRAVESLQEEPVMFYEPLSYVLDETTKEFVKEVVEERIKLEMRNPEAEDKNDLAREMEDMENELKQLRAENKHLRGEAARNADKAKRMEEMEMRAKEEAAQQKKLYLQKCEEYAQLEEELRKFKDKLNEAEKRIDELQDEIKKASNVVVSDSPSNLRNQMDDLRSELDAHLAKIAELQDQISRLEQEKNELHAENQELRDAMKKKESELKALKEQNEALTRDLKGATGTTKVVTDDDALRSLQDQHKEVEKQLRATIKKLEQALEEERNKKKVVKQVKEQDEEDEIEKLKKKKKGGGFTEEELKEAVRKATDKLKEKISDLKEAIEKLEKETEEKDEEIKKLKKELKKALDAAGNGNDADEARRWKNKYEELLEKFEELEAKHEALEHKVVLLIEKLRQYGGEEAVQASLAEIKLDPPPMRPKRKKKAWERLYDDAVRRLSAAKAKAARQKALEEKELEKLKRVVQSSRSARKQVDALGHLQKAKQESEDHYYDALARFTERNKDLLEGEVAVDDNDLESGLEFVCPKCDFRLQPRRRSPSPARGEPTSQHGSHVSFAQTLAPQPGEYTRPNVGYSFSQPLVQLNRTESFGNYQGTFLSDGQLSPSQRPASFGSRRLYASQSSGNLGNTYDIAARDMHVRGASKVSPSRSNSQNRSQSPNETLAASLSPKDPRTLRHAATFSPLASAGSTTSGLSPALLGDIGGAFVTGAADGAHGDGVAMRSSGARVTAAGRGSRSTSPAGGPRERSPPRLQQMPWRQSANGESGVYSPAPVRDTDVLPWKPQGGTRNPPPPQGARVAVPPGWTKAGSPTGQVPGRVPSTGALEPLPARLGVRTASSSLSPRSRSDGLGVSGNGHAGQAQRDPSPERRKLDRDYSASDKPLAATLTGGAGRSPKGLALSRSVSNLPAAAVLLPTTQAFTGGFSVPVARVADSSAPTADMKPRRMAQTLPTQPSPPIAGTDIPGQKFLVTPLVSQQSMAAGVPLPMPIPQ